MDKKDDKKKNSEEQRAKMPTEEMGDLSEITSLSPEEARKALGDEKIDISKRLTEPISSRELRDKKIGVAGWVTEPMDSEDLKHLKFPEEKKATKKQAVDSFFRGDTGEVIVPTQPSTPPKRSTEKQAVDGFFRGDTGMVSVPPKAPAGSSEDMFAPAFELAPPQEPLIIPDSAPLEAEPEPPQKTAPALPGSSLLDAQKGLSTDQFTLGLDGIQPLGKEKKSNKTLFFLLLFSILLGGGGFATWHFLESLLFPRPGKALKQRWLSQIRKGNFEQAHQSLAKLKKIVSDQEGEKYTTTTVVALLERVAKLRKADQFKEGKKLLLFYLSHYKKYNFPQYTIEVGLWKDRIYWFLKEENFDKLYGLFAVLEGFWATPKERETFRKKIDKNYIQYLDDQGDFSAVLKALTRVDPSALPTLERTIRKKVKSLSSQTVDEGIDLILQYARKKRAFPRIFFLAIQHLLYKKHLQEGREGLAHFKFKNAYRAYLMALKISPDSWESLREIDKIKNKFLKKYLRSLPNTYKLIQEGLAALKSDFPELSIPFFGEGLSRSIRKPSVYQLIAPYKRFAKKVQGMAYISSGSSSGFYMDRHEVTNEEYGKFLRWITVNKNHSFCHTQEKGLYPSKDHTPANWKKSKKWRGLPVMGVDWYDCYGYARWAGKRLPTPKEWQDAAKSPGGNPWPWGQSFDLEKVNSFYTALPVGSFPADKSTFGCFDMLANLREWTGPLHDDRATVCGGDFQGKQADDFLPSRRISLSANFRDKRTGFRCAKDDLKSK